MINPDQLADLVDLVHKVAIDGIDGLDDEATAEVALLVRRGRELFDHVEVHALGALEDSGYTEREFILTTASWLSREAGLAAETARAQVNAVWILRRHLHDTDQAWLDGTITRDHVDVLARAANPRIRELVAAAENDLIALAEGRTFTTWREAVRSAVSRLDQDGPDPNDPTNATASWSRSGAFGVLKAQFGGEAAEVIIQILDAKTDDLYRRQQRDRELSTDFVELTRGQLRFQALYEIVQAAGFALPDAEPSSGPSDAAPQATIHLVLRPRDRLPSLYPEPDVPGSFTDATWSLTNLNGDHLVLEHFTTLLCDCQAHALLVDDNDNPLKLGRAARCAPPELRRAVIIRDGGCAVPGCDAKDGWLAIHHVKKWKDGGQTDIHNLVALCRRHHGITHRKGWTLHATGDGWFWWQTPSGHTFWSQRHGKQRAGPAPPPVGTTAAA